MCRRCFVAQVERFQPIQGAQKALRGSHVRFQYDHDHSCWESASAMLNGMSARLLGKRNLLQAVMLGLGLGSCVFAGTQQNYDSSIPAEFLSDNVSDPVSKLREGIQSGKVALTYEAGQGYLKSILRELGISADSQVLVFSKTSLQSAFISQDTPRAIYFNDRAYVGWIPGAPNLELVGIDPRSGPVFFVLPNRLDPKPAPSRQTLACFQCHDSVMTGQVPGLMARSVFAGQDGAPRFAGGSFVTTASSPMSDRWGGWFVTGRHGSQRHMGNEPARGDEQNPVIDREKGANLTDLRRYFDVDTYLTPHSDIVALMVAEQQMSIQNSITKLGYLTRRAQRDAEELLKLKFDADHVAEETRGRIHSACEPLVQKLLCADEPKLSAPIRGTSGFSVSFSTTAPADHLGRRLSMLDLNTRLLRFPCSPAIYSSSFRCLPVVARTQVFKRIIEILTSVSPEKAFISFAATDRKAVVEVLRDTLPEFESEFAHSRNCPR